MKNAAIFWAMMAFSGPALAATILRNARVSTDGRKPAVPLSIVVEGSRIVFVGQPAEADRKYPRAEGIDLSGSVVYPGLSDAHGHLAELGKALESADLKGASSAEECARRMKERPGPADSWAEGDGWDQNLWTPKSFPDASTLDAVFPGRPAFAVRIDGHAIWANTAALRAAGVTSATSDPPGGKILRRADGSPSGVLVDNAMDVVARAKPAPTDETLRRYFRAALESCAAVGLTAVGDASGYGEREIAVLRRMSASGELPIRVYATVGALSPGWEGVLQGGHIESPLLTVRAVKVYADGALGSRGAELLADYSDDAGNRGLAVTPAATIETVAERCFRAGFQLWIHAIGDRGNRDALDAIAAAERAVPSTDPRPRIEHAQVVAIEDRKRFAALGVIASIQPSFTTSDMPWAQARLSSARVGESYAWRSLQKAGARLAGGSDFPVESNDPRKGIYAAVTRQDARGNPPGGWRPEEDLSREDAVSLYTADAAYAMFQEKSRGAVAAGMNADLTAFDRDLVACPPAEILGARVRMTMADGKIVFRGP